MGQMCACLDAPLDNEDTNEMRTIQPENPAKWQIDNLTSKNKYFYNEDELAAHKQRSSHLKLNVDFVDNDNPQPTILDVSKATLKMM